MSLPRRSLAILLVTGLSIGISGTVLAQDGPGVAAALEQQTMRVVRQAREGVVSIAKVDAPPRNFSQLETTDRSSLPSSPDFVPTEFGTGVLLIRSDGTRMVLTNYHVVRGGTIAKSALQNDPERPAVRHRLFVRFANRKGVYAEIFAADPRSDLAILAVDQEACRELTPLSPTLDNMTPGRFVMLMGNPYAIARDGSPSVGWGLVANRLRRPMPLPFSPFDPTARKEETLHHLGTLLHLDARLNLGYSGGAVLNLKGDLVGLTTSLAAIEGYEQTSGFAVPFSKSVLRIVADLMRGLEPEYGFLGISPGDVSLERVPGLEPQPNQPTAALVRSVVRNSPAADAGVSPGDIVLRIDDQPVYNTYDLMRTVSEHGPSESLADAAMLTVWSSRERKVLTLRAALQKWPVRDDEGLITSASRYDTWTKLDIDYITGRSRFLDAGAGPRTRGVLIRGVPDDSPFHQRVEPGAIVTAINKTRVTTPQEFVKTLPTAGSVTFSLADGTPLTATLRNGVWTVSGGDG